MIGIIATLSRASGPLTEPPSVSPFLNASSWVLETLLGTLATSVAVIAVAILGLLLLTGRANIRHGLTVLAGCFLLFGAATIARGIRDALEGRIGEDNRAVTGSVAPSPLSVIATPTPAPRSQPYDPYAGAAVPQQH
ncbi:TrbC/VirB2 family protein [Sphingomonas sp. RS6]